MDEWIVGLILIELGKPEDASGFAPARLAKDLDFFSFHMYPGKGKFASPMNVLKRVKELGKPMIIEEIFPLNCDTNTLRSFIEGSREYATGWLSFYWGQTPAELSASTKINDQLTLSWLKLFQAMNPNR